LKKEYNKLFKTAKKNSDKTTFANPDICKTSDSKRQNSIPTPNYGKNSDRKQKSKRAKIHPKTVNRK